VERKTHLTSLAKLNLLYVMYLGDGFSVIKVLSSLGHKGGSLHKVLPFFWGLIDLGDLPHEIIERLFPLEYQHAFYCMPIK
jgi:hypothetical protein